jgi:hypothetical protein
VGWSKTLLAAGIELCCLRKSTIAMTSSGHFWHILGIPLCVDIMLQHSFISISIWYEIVENRVLACNQPKLGFRC